MKIVEEADKKCKSMKQHVDRSVVKQMIKIQIVLH